jgi:hypothetical protein
MAALNKFWMKRDYPTLYPSRHAHSRIIYFSI